MDGHVGPRLAGSFLPRFSETNANGVRFLSDLYDGGVRCTDAEVGRLLDTLAASGWGDDTAVLVLSDHGEAFGEHDDLDHASHYRSVTHVPFMLHAPGGITGRRNEPVSGVDVLPTVLDVKSLSGNVNSMSMVMLMGCSCCCRAAGTASSVGSRMHPAQRLCVNTP